MHCEGRRAIACRLSERTISLNAHDVRRTLILLATAVCHRPHDLAVGHRGGAPPITVRLAAPPEHVFRPVSFESSGNNYTIEGDLWCPLKGERAPELVAPIATFARANLVDRFRKMFQEASTFVLSADHKIRPRIDVEVDARSQNGERRVVAVAPPWSPEAIYCFAVIHADGETTVVIELHSRLQG